MPVFSSYFINYDLSKCKMLTNLTLLQIQGFQNIRLKKKTNPVPETLFQSTNYSHSPFLMVFCSAEAS